MTFLVNVVEMNIINIKKITKTLTIKTGEELVFKGLGWVSVKRGPLKIEVTLAEEIEISIRKAFIKPRR